MVHAGAGGLDTPRTNVGDTTFTSKAFDFDISQEPSFQSPSRDSNNLVRQMQKGGRGVIKTPRSRVALGDRRNLPAGLGGGEFTPLLKSATRNSALRNGKENNALQTPAFLKGGGLGNIPEDLPHHGSSVYGDSQLDYTIAGTPAPQLESSSAASTPMALLPRRNEGPGVLQDGNQLSLREQENMIDKVEKENFGLKLKIHFLEEALRKAGPGFSEAALKENTELKVDRVTMQKELIRYRKTLSSAERDLETYRLQVTEMHEKVKQRNSSAGQKEAMDRLQQALEDSEVEINRLKLQVSKFEDLQDHVEDLEAAIREKNRLVDDREDEVENLKEEVEKHLESISLLKESVKKEQRRNVELEEKAQGADDLEDAKESIDKLERELKRVQDELEEAKDYRQEAIKERDRAQDDLEELQGEMANKSITTKGLSRQIEDKVSRLQDEVEDFREKYTILEEDYAEQAREVEHLQAKVNTLKTESESNEKDLHEKLKVAQVESRNASLQRDNLKRQLETTGNDLQQKADEKNLLQVRHDALTQESSSLQKELARARDAIEDLEDKLSHEKTFALNNEREVRDEYKNEIDRLSDEIEDLRADVREKKRLHENDSAKWSSEKRALISQKTTSDEKAETLQRAIDKLQVAEGNLSSKETMLKNALQAEKDRHKTEEDNLKRQLEELNEDASARRKALEQARSELASVREELRLSQREQRSLTEKVEGLEDEVEILQTSLDDESEQANRKIAVAKKESDNLRRQLEALKQDLERAEATATAARHEIEDFHSNIQADQGNKDVLKTTLKDVEAQLVKLRLDKKRLQDQLASMTAEMHALRLSKSEAEAERDEVHSQMKSVKRQDDETYRLEQERVDLRTAKLKLDAEVRRLRDETRAAITQQELVERELQEEIDRASAEESRLSNEIQDLQKILRGSSEKRELSTAKKTISQLEQRIRELETDIAQDRGNDDETQELSIVRQDLLSARQRETELLQREASQKEVIRSLKRQINELERKVHDAEVSRLVVPSPASSVGGSARKSEVNELRTQLLATQQSLKEIRSHLKNVEKESAQKVNNVNMEFEAQVAEWETEKDELERSLDEAHLTINELTAKNATSEAKASRLKGKIGRLEKALDAERLNHGPDRTMVLERRDLHEMLRETQVQVETFEVDMQEKDNTIAIISAAEAELRSQVKRVREERSHYRAVATSAQNKLKDLERRFKEAEQDWDTEKAKMKKHRAESSGAQVQLSVLERQFLEIRETLETEKKLVTEYRSKASSAEKQLATLDKQYKDAEQKWTLEKQRLVAKSSEPSSSDIELKVLEKQFKAARDNWDAEKKTLSEHCFHFTSAQIELKALEQKFKEAQESWETEKKKLAKGSAYIPPSALAAQHELKALKQKFKDAQEKWSFERVELENQRRISTDVHTTNKSAVATPSRRSSMRSPSKGTVQRQETTITENYTFTDRLQKRTESRHGSHAFEKTTAEDATDTNVLQNPFQLHHQRHISGGQQESSKSTRAPNSLETPRSTRNQNMSTFNSPGLDDGSLILNIKEIDRLISADLPDHTADFDATATTNLSVENPDSEGNTLTTNFSAQHPGAENDTTTTNFTMEGPGVEDNTGSTNFTGPNFTVNKNTTTSNFLLRGQSMGRNTTTILLPEAANLVGANASTTILLPDGANSFALQNALDELEQRFSQAEQAWEEEKQQFKLLETTYKSKEEIWEAERQKLTSGVRFVNTSVSTVNNEHDCDALKKQFKEKEYIHVREMRGMQLQVEWLRAKCQREEGLRSQCAAAKKYIGKQIETYSKWYVCPVIIMLTSLLTIT
jgi:chromosome segregation ATPase